MSTKRFSGSLAVILMALHRSLSLLEVIGIVVASLGILMMMFVTGVDVILRYVVSSPLTWWYDFLMNYVLLASFYLAFSYTLAHHGHLAVDFFASKLPRPAAFLMSAAGFLASGILLLLVGHSAVHESIVSFINDDVLAGVILWPVWISKALVAWGILVLALRSVHFSACYFVATVNEAAFHSIGLARRLDELEEVTQ